MITRRELLGGLAGSAVLFLRGRILADDAAEETALPKLGRLKTLHARDIRASHLSIGFETLDRRQFEPERAYKHVGNLGAKWARLSAGWGRCESVKGQYDFRWLDEIVDSLAREGVQAWFNLGYGNKFYTPGVEDDSAVGFSPIFTAEARAGWTAFVTHLARHFAGRVKGWEIWNDPNDGGFWRPQKPNAASYVQLVEITAPILRRESSDAAIVGGSVSTCNLPFLEGCFDAGMGRHVDAVSFHPYWLPYPEDTEEFVEGLRQLLEKHGSTAKLWQTECGCPSDPKTEAGTDSKGRKWSEAGQAKWLLRRVLTDLCQELDLTSYFTTVDLTHYNWGSGPTDHAQSYGVLRGSDYSPKPSYFAYQSLCALFDAQVKRDRRIEIAATTAVESKLKTTGFARNDRPLGVYWLVTDLLDPFTPKTVSLRLSGPTLKGMRPVLIDPISQQIFDLKANVSPDGPHALRIDGLPLMDYPLIIADRESLQLG